MENKFIYAFSEETKKELLDKGFRLLKGDSKPFIFDNSNNINFSEIEGLDFCFSDVMLF